MTEPELLTVEFTDVGPRGDAMGTGPDGRPIYARYVLPGERAVVRVRKRGKSSTTADLERIEQSSPRRVDPRCPLFGTCDGCQLQHADYALQLELKTRMVTQQLARFGGLVDAPVRPTIGAPTPWNYRNHARFTVRGGRLGFVRRHRRRFFEVPVCHIVEPAINRVLAALQGQVGDITMCNVRVGADHGDVAIQPVLPVSEPRSGQAFVTERVAGRRFRVSSAAFFQVHRAQAEVLIERVCTAIGPAGLVVDAYAGVGSFAAALARQALRVVAIEESGPAVKDAQENLADLTNVEIRLGKTEEVLPSLVGAVDAVVLDPPRSGCHAAVIEALARVRPRRVVYVSCEPSTLARDLRLLVDAGFALHEVQPLDMFPHTIHVECVATLFGSTAA